MHTGFIFSRFLSKEKRRCFVFSLLWLTGLLLGTYLAVINATKIDPVIYAALIQKQSFLQKALLNCLILSLMAFLCFLKCYPVIAPLIFLLSFSRGFSGISLYVFLGSGAWVIRSLFLFSGICISVISWWLLLKRFGNKRYDIIKAFCLPLIAAIIISIADYFIVTPFFTSITEQII